MKYFCVLAAYSLIGTLALSPVNGQRCLSKASNFPDKALLSLDEPSIRQRSVLVIPIVFHVVWNTIEQNISDTQIFSQLDALNRDYRRRNSEYNQISPMLKGISADMEIEFCLAGIAQGGIIRKETNHQDIGVSTNVFYDAQGGSNAVMPEQFLNVWVCALGNDVLGYTNALGFGNVQEEGVVIDYKNFGSTGTAVFSRWYHAGRTLTHEIGHYLGLLHPWGHQQFECVEDDFVDDTPLQYGAIYGCTTKEGEVYCGGAVPNMENFMGFADDCCMAMFTLGQKERVYAFLQQFRPDWVDKTEALCATPLDHQFLVFPNPATHTINIQWESDEYAVVKVYSILGVLVLEKEIQKGINIFCIDGLARGIYQVILADQEHKVKKTIKLIKINI